MIITVAGIFHIITGDVQQGLTGITIHVRMIGVGLHGRDDGGNPTGSSNGNALRIIHCEDMVRVLAGRWAGGSGMPAMGRLCQDTQHQLEWEQGVSRL